MSKKHQADETETNTASIYLSEAKTTGKNTERQVSKWHQVFYSLAYLLQVFFSFVQQDMCSWVFLV